MNRKIFYIIVGAIALIALVILLWVWFLNRPSTAPSAQNTFGNASSTQNISASGGNQAGNIAGNVNQQQTAGTNVSGSLIGTTLGSVVGTAGGVYGSTTPANSSNGSQWLMPEGTSGGSSAGGMGSAFSAKDINQLNTGSVGGTPTILGNTALTSDSGSSGVGLGAALAVAGIGTALCTAGLLGGVSAGAAAGGAGVGGTAAQTVVAVPVNDISLNLQVAYGNTLKSSDTFKANFLDCVTRTIAKAALQQITASVVNWINSGFKGSPSFVTNYQQFFKNVADLAAGEYIKGSALSFLCSPFQMQIRIALAQSYANRSAMTCSLSKIVSNINGFMNGNFVSGGGWGGLLQVTTVPTNNPYGAFAYAQIGLAGAQASAYANANRNMTATGFLNFQQEYGCKTAQAPSTDGTGAVVKYGCSYKTVTPGSVIESSLANTLGVSQRTLTQAGVSGSFDAIISALITQLMTRALYSGLTNLSGNSGYTTNYLTPDQQQAQDQAQALMTAMQTDVGTAQQYGNTQQGSIQDIENSQQQLNDSYNCWSILATSQAIDSSKAALAATRAQEATSTINQLNTQIDVYNNNILRANTAIVILQGLQTQALNVASLSDSQALATSYEQAQASGQIITSADVTSAQQDRTTLQSQLTSLNANTSEQLTQCHAYGS